jgi:phosphate transport system permease protein
MSIDQTKVSESPIDLASPRLAMRRKLRHLYDRSAKVLIGIGGIGVIVAILLIFLYLFYEVVPLFESAELDSVAEYQVQGTRSSETLHLAVEEQSELAMRLDASGQVLFFEVENGDIRHSIDLPVPEGRNISSFALESEQSGLFALGFDNGEILIAAYDYQTSFSTADNSRIISPVIEYPFGENPYQLFDSSETVAIALRVTGENMLLSGVDETGKIALLRASRQVSLFAAFDAPGTAANFDIRAVSPSIIAPDTRQIFVDGDQLWLYLVNGEGQLRLLDIRKAFNDEVNGFAGLTRLTSDSSLPTEIEFLLGGISLLVAGQDGSISQWFLVRENDTVQLEKVREFSDTPNAITALSTEQRRKDFFTVDTDGIVSIYNTTAHREVFRGDIASSGNRFLAVSPRGDSLLLESSGGSYSFFEVHNEHPEVSWSAIWDKVWYEGYSEPDYIWQSSAATNEFEPKYSLVPLSFGTLKAAFYAMLLAAPLAICGAIFTGYFMAPAMRKKVKPLIELMEALPTVVLGFLAGLWLAPFVELNLLGIFTVLIILPVSILMASIAWANLPEKIRHSVPEGWEAGILIPVILLFTYLSFVVATPIETLFFNGDLRYWISNDLGVSYDQRNAMVVGFAMGFAVIPTIFSIAEDAIFTVPRHLTYGSLALGATPWQSLQRVVLPTASPGIFSALMIGMGRAVGETMIVLMATGNTPIMDINIFEGMRTLAANIAVEIPESEVDSTHYRILFLAALVLFTFTFVFNTVAEIVRQRLRDKYSTI